MTASAARLAPATQSPRLRVQDSSISGNLLYVAATPGRPETSAVSVEMPMAA